LYATVMLRSNALLGVNVSLGWKWRLGLEAMGGHGEVDIGELRNDLVFG